MVTAMLIVANSGDFCPETGIWISNGIQPEKKVINQGEVFEALNDQPTKWRLILVLTN
jgi:hypothetical protein